MPVEVSHLPAHVLLVHAVVVLVPLSALTLVLAAVWPAFRRRLGILVPLLALVSLVFVPVTTHAGEWLEARVPRSPLVHRHTELGDTLLPWALGVFVVAAGLWLLYRRRHSSAADAQESSAPRRGARVVPVLAAVLAVVVSAGALVQTYRIGESGARAAWQGQFSQTPARHVEKR